MEVSHILESLNQPFPVPTQAIRAALAQKEEVVPVLLDRLKVLVDDPEGAPIDKVGDLVVLYLLAQHKEKRAFSYIMQLANLPEEWTELFFGDVKTEGLPSFIVSTYDGNLALIKDLIENESANVYCRVAALNSLLGLYVINQLSRDEIIEYYRYLLKTHLIENECFATMLVDDILSFYPQELYKEVIDLIDKELVDTWYCGDKEAVDEKLALGMERCIEEEIRNDRYISPITDTETEVAWLYREEEKKGHGDNCKCADEEDDEDGGDDEGPLFFIEQSVTMQRTEPKIGRNEKCPCNSGKKYKKCCLMK